MKDNIKDSIEEKNFRKNKKKKSSIVLKIILVFLILFSIAIVIFTVKMQEHGGGVQGILATILGQDANTLQNLEEIRALVVGTSQNMTDTIMVASYNPKTQQASLLSIPRDTFVGKNKKKAVAAEKINSLYHGKDVQKLLDAVNDVTGLGIENYVIIDTEALIKLVDELGGVYFNVPMNMNYDDETQDLHIHLEEGYQHIDGAKAEQLLRFRKNNDGTGYSREYGADDYGRMRTQREFITEFVKQSLTAKNVFKMGDIVDILQQYINTNFDFSGVKDYIPYLVSFDTSSIKTATLPGISEKHNGVWIYLHDKEESETLINEMFNSGENINTESNNVIVELLNGSGSDAKLYEAIKDFSEAGYTIASYCTTTTTKITTIIEKTKTAEEHNSDLINLLGKAITSSLYTESPDVDCTIILGEDYEIKK